jgi:hypothetical protein
MKTMLKKIRNEFFSDLKKLLKQKVADGTLKTGDFVELEGDDVSEKLGRGSEFFTIIAWLLSKVKHGPQIEEYAEVSTSCSVSDEALVRAASAAYLQGRPWSITTGCSSAPDAAFMDYFNEEYDRVVIERASSVSRDKQNALALAQRISQTRRMILEEEDDDDDLETQHPPRTASSSSRRASQRPPPVEEDEEEHQEHPPRTASSSSMRASQEEEEDEQAPRPEDAAAGQWPPAQKAVYEPAPMQGRMKKTATQTQKASCRACHWGPRRGSPARRGSQEGVPGGGQSAEREHVYDDPLK